MWGFELIIMAAMIAVNSVFAGYEIALASVTVARLRQLASESRPGAAVALYMKENMEASLAVVQLGITLVGAIAAAVGGAGAEEKLAPILAYNLGIGEGTADFLAIVLVVLPLTVVTIIVGELIPKVYSLRHAEWVCLTISPYMRWFSRSVWPAVWLFEAIVIKVMSWGEPATATAEGKTETASLAELRSTAALARASRLIGHREEGIILGATEMQSRPIRDIMLPAESINMLHVEMPIGDALVAAHMDMHTRFPVVEKKGDPQTVIGYVNVKDIIAAMHLHATAPSLRAISRALPSLPDDLPIAESLDRLIAEHTHIALVRDKQNRVVGMITLEDIIEELVGDIGDEYDRLPAHIVSTGPAWIVGGGATLDQLKKTTGIDLIGATKCGDTRVSEWVTDGLGREIRGGDRIERGNVRVLVRKARRRRVQEAQLEENRTNK